MADASESRSSMAVRRRLTILVVLVAALSACAQEYRDAESFRIVSAGDGLFGLRCQPRTEFYFFDRDSGVNEYLGTCSTPRFVTDQLDVPGDPSCFAISADGLSLVYVHRPEWCGAGEKAQRKPGGVYRYSPAGDSLIYPASQAGQVWSQTPIEPHAIRVSWRDRDANGQAIGCPHYVTIFADQSQPAIHVPIENDNCRD